MDQLVLNKVNLLSEQIKSIDQQGQVLASCKDFTPTKIYFKFSNGFQFEFNCQDTQFEIESFLELLRKIRIKQCKDLENELKNFLTNNLSQS